MLETLIIFLTFLIEIEVIAVQKCFISEISKLDPQEYFVDVATNSDRPFKLLQLLHNSERPLAPDVQKLFDFILKKVSSTNRREQWMAMSWAILVSGLGWPENPDMLCLSANYLNDAFEIQNGDMDIDKFNCIFKEDLSTRMDLHYTLTKHVLWKRGCSTENVPNALTPDCFDPSKCINGGTFYHFYKIWQQYNIISGESEYGLLSEKNDFQELYDNLKPLYESDNLCENHVAAIVTKIVMQYDWLMRTKVLDTEHWYEYVKALGLIAEVATSATECGCDDLEKLLLSSVENYLNKAETLILQLKENKHLIGCQGFAPCDENTNDSDADTETIYYKTINHEF